MISKADVALGVAWKYHGTPYIWGGDDPVGFDCCVPENELIHTPEGPKRIVEIKVGDKVWGTTKEGELKEQTVVAVHDNGLKPTVLVRTNKRRLCVTGNHPILGYRKVKVKRGAAWTVRQEACLDWHDAAVLAPGDWIVVLRKTIENTKHVTVEQARVLGAFIGDGCVSNSNHCSLAFFEHKLRQKYIGLIKKAWPDVRDFTLHPSHGIYMCSKPLVSGLRGLGLYGYSHQRKVPGWVFSSSKEIQNAFLAGYCEADGYITTHKKGKYKLIHFAASSEELIRGIHLLLSLRGEQIASITITKRPSGMTIKGVPLKNPKPIFRFDWYVAGKRNGTTGMLIKNFRELVGLHLDSSIEKITKIEQGPKLYTYNLTVTPDQSFVVGGVATHNSGLIIECLKSVGALPRKGDWTADELYQKFTKIPPEQIQPGDLIFWEGDTGKMIHVEIVIASDLSIGASGGGSWAVDAKVALEKGAYVKIRPFTTRGGKYYFARPPYNNI